MTIAHDPPEVTSASTAHSEVVVESPKGEEKNDDAPRAVVNDRETSVPDDGNGDGDTPAKKV